MLFVGGLSLFFFLTCVWWAKEIVSSPLKVRVTLLSWDELPIKRIQGKVTGDFINIDGNSIVRRTCYVIIYIIYKNMLIS